ncbi:MAG: 50S ribosomal protein L1 [Verrucomicrobia bacterium CAG:312_58_20]|nr:MAG: 50S ribosomal protein L1 [Verrucomicrobia bacterium CAG:312_58_20]
MVKRSKRYRKAAESLAQKPSALADAVAALQSMPKAGFDETVELSFKLNVDPKQSNQMVRGTVRLPNGSGKKVRVVVFTDHAESAIAAGADKAGLEDLIKEIEGGWMEFDVAVATTSAMKEVRKLARILGPRGLMPNPKSGTVTDDVESAIKEVKGGRVEYKMDKTANLSVVVGKRSFANDKLVENARAALSSVAAARPEMIKGKFINSITISSTMSPGVKVDLAEAAE